MCALSATAVGKAELENRIWALTAKFAAMQSQPDKRIPPDILRQAQGIILLDRTKAGFIFAFEGGGGVALVKNPKTRDWSPAAFVTANEASLGFQIGGEKNFYVILLMNTNATRLLTGPKADFGGEARGTAGNVSAGAGTSFVSPPPPMLVYSERQGLYGGAAIGGGAVAPDTEANCIYYGNPVNMSDILFNKMVKPTAAGADLAARITAYSKPPPPK